ncbi:Amacr [Symbiodinium pilosum]|uniref:Amacr protein n=1 Tax=Symbiodinium pilosum TaxID=2952 RepID=A0A812UJZ9_SYMPI|nr:Amacr [Symbiodinium pilosum]
MALAQLLQWSGGSRPASAVGYIYKEEGGNLHRWVVQSHGGVQNFVAAHADAGDPGIGPCPLAACVLADFGADAASLAGGAMMLAMGVLLALLERSKSGCGQVIDAAMVDGANYTALPLFKWMQTGLVPVGSDGHMKASDFILCQAPHWSDVYLCKEDPAKKGTRQYVSVQAIEPQFYRVLLKGLGLATEELPSQYDRKAWPQMKSRFAEIFRTKTRDEWAQVFKGTDACCVPVLNATEAAAHPHNRKRRSFEPTPGAPGVFEPAPAPKLSRTPGHVPRPCPVPGGNTREVLLENCFSKSEVDNLLKEGVIAEARRELSKL